MKVTKLELQMIFSGAKQNYIDDTPGELDNQQYQAQCYVKSVLQVLQIKVDVEFPTRISIEPVE
jgi:hypothetical protein